MISSGMRDKRVRIFKKTESDGGKFGRGAAAPTWNPVFTVWANVSFSRGTKAMRHGALDAYDVIMVRMNYVNCITRDCRLEYDGRMWEIESFNRDYQRNEIQVTAHEVIS